MFSFTASFRGLCEYYTDVFERGLSKNKMVHEHSENNMNELLKFLYLPCSSNKNIIVNYSDFEYVSRKFMTMMEIHATLLWEPIGI